MFKLLDINCKAEKSLWGLGLLMALFMTGCANQTVTLNESSRQNLQGTFSVPEENIIVPTFNRLAARRDQANIIKLSEYLDEKAVTDNDKARIFYTLGVSYDRLNMEVMARTMFMNALMQKSNYSDPYNFIGIYMASDGRLADALEAFDSALELDAKNSYVYFNRGIVLYYANKFSQARDDLLAFYEKFKEDPYILLWLYLDERQMFDEYTARQNLRDRFSKVGFSKQKELWGFEIIKYYLNDISERAFIEGIRATGADQDAMAEHLCEAYFYMGKQAQAKGNDKLAYDYFHLAAATQLYGFLECRYALHEIRRIESRHGITEDLAEDFGIENLEQ